MRYAAVWFVLGSILAWAGLVDGIAIVVKDKPVTLYDIEQVMEQEHVGPKKAADYLIRSTLEAMEIETRGIHVSEDEINRRVEQMAVQNGMQVPQLYDAIWNAQHLTRDAFRDKLRKMMLTQKLYAKIAMTSLEEPTDEELKEYYRLHPEKFSHPKSFELTVYSSSDKSDLQRKIAYPMGYLPSVKMQNTTLDYARLAPQLAALLQRTKDGAFTPILPDPKGGYVAFYVRARSMPVMLPFERVRAQVEQELMADEREQMLKDYFNRARMNAQIKILRLPEGGS